MCKSCKSCPINITTEEGEYADNTGCLPHLNQALTWFLDTGKVWACHSNNKKPCAGFILRAKESKGIDIVVTDDTVLITEQMTIKEIYTNKFGGPILISHCEDCMVDVYADNKDYYMVTNHIWYMHGNGKGKLCWKCLENRMGRPINAWDIELCPLTTFHNKHTRQMLIDAGRLDKLHFVNAFRNHQKIAD